jgi:hypothetical protein
MTHDIVPALERRAIARTTINRDALLFFRGESGPSPCCIRNITNLGAGIQLDGTTVVPDEFDISFDRFRTRRVCRLIWSRGDFVGVAFTDETSAAVD